MYNNSDYYYTNTARAKTIPLRRLDVHKLVFFRLLVQSKLHMWS